MKNRTFIICLIVIVVVFGILMFASCGKKGADPVPKSVSESLSRPFDAKAAIKMKDLVLEADINRTSPGKATIQVNEPKSLAGMNFTYDGKDIVVSYHGLSVKLDENSKLVSSLLSIIVNSIDKAASPSGVDVSLQGDQLVVSGESDSGKFNVTLDKNSRSIVSVSVPELDFECRFDDFIFEK